MEKQEILDVIAKMGLTVTAKFVPFSHSRNKAEKTPSLNWIVTVLRNGREVLATEYSAGMGHSYNKATPKTWNRSVKEYRAAVCAVECETGFSAMQFYSWASDITPNKKAPILPDTADVFYSLIMDSSVLDSGTFEDWAADFGYDSDSRKGESIYRTCLEIALKLRNGIGESGLSLLRETFQDY